MVGVGEELQSFYEALEAELRQVSANRRLPEDLAYKLQAVVLPYAGASLSPGTDAILNFRRRLYPLAGEAFDLDDDYWGDAWKALLRLYHVTNSVEPGDVAGDDARDSVLQNRLARVLAQRDALLKRVDELERAVRAADVGSEDQDRIESILGSIRDVLSAESFSNNLSNNEVGNITGINVPIDLSKALEPVTASLGRYLDDLRSALGPVGVTVSTVVGAMAYGQWEAAAAVGAGMAARALAAKPLVEPVQAVLNTAARFFEEVSGTKRPGGAGPPRIFREVNEPWCPEIVEIPSGEFLMGDAEGDESGYGDERPQHRVKIGYRFALSRYLVTFDE